MIDSHQHFWKYDPVRDSWIDESMEVIRKDFLPSDLEPILKANNVDGCIAVQADQSEKETEFLLQCAAENPFIKGVVGWVDLLANNVEERLAHFSKDSLFKGVRHIVQAEPNDFMLRPNFQHGIGKLAQFGLTYDILVYPHQLPVAVQLAQKFPNQKFVLDHMAKPQISEGLDAQWVSNIQKLASHQNVFCKLSGMVTETKDFNWKRKDFTSFLDVAVQAFGTDRVMFGSDWPVCLLAAQYAEVLMVVENYLAGFSKNEIFKIMGGNATKFYNIL